MTVTQPSTRREFLAAALLGTAAALNPSLMDAAITATPVPAIDTHIHLYDPARPQGVPWPPKNLPVLYSPHLPKQFQALAAPLGIAGAVVIEASEWVDDNQWVLDLIKDEPMIVGYIGNLPPVLPDFPTQLKRFAANLLFRGLRFHQNEIASGVGQGTFAKNVQLLADRQLTLDVVGNPSMLPDVLRLAKLAPKLRIVIDHLPFRDGPQDVATLRQNLAEIAQQPNIHAKISDVPRRTKDQLIVDVEYYRPALDALCELFGPDRLFYGSNWPVSDLMAPYVSMHQIVTDYFQTKRQHLIEKFFWKNSLAAYSWLPRGDAGKLIGK